MPRATNAEYLSRAVLDLIQNPTTSCAIWNRGKSSNGYGAVHSLGKQRLVHRMACELAHGPIPAGFEVSHACHTPLCFNPEHLLAVHPDEHTIIDHERASFIGKLGAPRRRARTYRNNTSGYPNVFFNKDRGSWFSAFQYKKRKYRVPGVFPSALCAFGAFRSLYLEVTGISVSAPETRNS